MLSKDVIEKIRELRSQGYSYEKIAKTLKISKPTVIKYLKNQKNNLRTTSQDISEVSIDVISKVFELFEKGIRPEKVVIKLKLHPDIVKSIFQKYMELKNLVFENEIKKIREEIEKIKKMVESDPLSNLRNEFVCDSCGEKGYVAANIKCTKCGEESWWGWWPE